MELAPRSTPPPYTWEEADARETHVLQPQAIAARSPDSAIPAWLRDEAVQGVGIGTKIKSGVALDRPAMRVYVNEKRDRSQIADPVPPQITSAEGRQFVTDVIPVGNIRPQMPVERLRPIQPGCSLGHVAVTGGTLGCIVRKRGGGHERYILSNSHVLAASGMGLVNDAIVQPAIADGGKAGEDTIALLSAFIPFDYTQNGFPNEVDAALALINQPDIAFQLPILKTALKPSKLTRRLRAGMRVQKTGRSSGHSWGKIVDTDFHAIVPYVNPVQPDTETQVFFRNQVLCTRFTEPGDSGALVLSSSGSVVGLHFAGSDRVSVFNRIACVFDALDIELDV